MKWNKLPLVILTFAAGACLACIVNDDSPEATSCVPLMDDENPNIYACMCVPCTGGLGCCEEILPGYVSGTINSYQGTRRMVKDASQGLDSIQELPRSCQWNVSWTCDGDLHVECRTPASQLYKDLIPAGTSCPNG